MPIFFITGNKNKFADAKSILPDLQQLDIDLPEIQEIDPHVIMRAKLEEAFRYHQGEFLVDDVSLSMAGLNGLPGPLIKWFMKSIGVEGIADLGEKIGNTAATVKAILGYAKSPAEIIFFEGSAKGTLVKPRGAGGFGWDVIFQPEGSNQTYAEWKELNPGKPNAMRQEALNKLKEHIYGR